MTHDFVTFFQKTKRKTTTKIYMNMITNKWCNKEENFPKEYNFHGPSYNHVNTKTFHRRSFVEGGPTDLVA